MSSCMRLLECSLALELKHFASNHQKEVLSNLYLGNKVRSQYILNMESFNYD